MTSACETCSSDFCCGRLEAILSVVEAAPELKREPALRQAYRQAKRLLADSGWNYPNATMECELATKNTEIQALTDRLIAALDEARHAD